jgi:hypothetical protein
VIGNPLTHRAAAAARGILAGLALVLLPAVAGAGVLVYESKDKDHTLELGMRLQPRMEFENVSTANGGTDLRRDFMIRRARLKANGKMQGVSFGFEWKLDNTDQFGAVSTAAVENAWLQYPMGGGFELRAGLYDQPFSRDLLTSDSRQLAVDRGEVSNVPSALGLADNIVGFSLYGKSKSSRVRYTAGLFDNRFILANRQDLPMLGGRIDLDLGSTKDIYQDAHFGEDKWYSIGVNGSVQSGIENAAGLDDSSHTAGGVDAMMDVPFRKWRVIVRGEANAIRAERIGTGENNTTVKMIGLGILMMKQRFQPFIRFDQQRGDAFVRGGRTDITYVGANVYQRGHNLKIQGDLRMQAGTNAPIDGGRLQAQIDW